MKSLRILRHLQQYELGFDTTSLPSPVAAGMLNPDYPYSGRLVRIGDGGFEIRGQADA